MSVMFAEEKYGPKAHSVNQIAEKLLTSDWYEKAGVEEESAEKQLQQFLTAINVSEYEIKWLTKKDFPEVIGHFSFNDSPLWDVLKDLPDHLKKAIENNNRVSLLEAVVDIIPEAVFHQAFDKAFKQFGDEKSVGFLVGHAMYMSVMACTADLADQGDLFTPILHLIGSGHVPVGAEGKTVYLL